MGKTERHAARATWTMALVVAVGCAAELDVVGAGQVRATLTGELEQAIVERFDTGEEEIETLLRDQATGRRFRLFFEEAVPPELEPGEHYAVYGLRDGSRVLVERVEPLLSHDPAPVGGAQATLRAHTGERTLIVILVETSHLSEQEWYHSTNTDPFGPDAVERIGGLLWTDDRNVADLYATATHGQTTFLPDVDQDGRLDIYGPYLAPEGHDHWRDWIPELHQGAEADGADPSLYQHTMYVMSTGSVAAGQVGCETTCDLFVAGATARTNGRVYAHELGHNLGLAHANGLSNQADDSDVMMIAPGLVLFNGPHADQMGSYAPYPGSVVTATGSDTYTLSAIGVDPGTSAHPFLVKFPRPGTDQNWYLSYRRLAGYDSILAPWHVGGVAIHAFTRDFEVVGADVRTWWGTTLSDGDEWTDPDGTNGIRITQLDHTDDTVTVSVSIPACGNGLCDGGETCSTCEDDCGACGSCGDGTCGTGEDCGTCPGDCGPCPTCGDGTCDPDEGCDTCEADCGSCATCGDGACNGDESCSTCASDCGACPYCGDGTCNGAETCDSCSGDCGACACLAKDAWCTSDAECCSGKCRGRAGAQRCKG